VDKLIDSVQNDSMQITVIKGRGGPTRNNN